MKHFSFASAQDPEHVGSEDQIGFQCRCNIRQASETINGSIFVDTLKAVKTMLPSVHGTIEAIRSSKSSR